MTIDEAIYCIKSYLPDNTIEHCLDCPYYGTVHDEDDQTAYCKSSEAHKLAITALEEMKERETAKYGRRRYSLYL